MKLSIIVPVYRVEATLDRCLQSIVRQQFSDFEVILVDDESPDGCPQLCDEWARRDCRITVVHQSNKGLSGTRNTGLALAKGEFLMFADSDDYIADGTLAAVMPLAEGTDLLEFPVYRFYGSDRQSLLRFDERSYDNVADYWLGCKAYEHAYAWNKVYRRQLFDGVSFPEGRVFEDVYTLPQLLRKCPRIKTTGKGLYYYCWNAHGITATAQGRQLQQLLDAHLTSGMPMDDAYYLHVLNIQIDVYRLTGASPQLPFRKVTAYRRLESVRQKLKAFVQNQLGIKVTCRILKTASSLSRW